MQVDKRCLCRRLLVDGDVAMGLMQWKIAGSEQGKSHVGSVGVVFKFTDNLLVVVVRSREV